MIEKSPSQKKKTNSYSLQYDLSAEMFLESPDWVCAHICARAALRTWPVFESSLLSSEASNTEFVSNLATICEVLCIIGLARYAGRGELAVSRAAIAADNLAQTAKDIAESKFARATNASKLAARAARAAFALEEEREIGKAASYAEELARILDDDGKAEMFADYMFFCARDLHSIDESERQRIIANSLKMPLRGDGMPSAVTHLFGPAGNKDRDSEKELELMAQWFYYRSNSPTGGIDYASVLRRAARWLQLQDIDINWLSLPSLREFAEVKVDPGEWIKESLNAKGNQRDLTKLSDAITKLESEKTAAGDFSGSETLRDEFDVNERQSRRVYSNEELRSAIRDQERASRKLVADLREEILENIRPLLAAREKLEEIDLRHSRLEQAIAGISDGLPTYGVVAQAEAFEKLVKKHRRASGYWLWVTLSLLVVTLVAAGFDYYQTTVLMIGPVAENAAAVVTSKILIFSLLSFGIIWSGRNYRAEKHNEAANQHRATSLNTYQAVHAGAQDEGTKNALLLFAADAMFRDRPTGYDSAEKDSKHINPVISEVVKVVARTSNGK